MEKYPGRIRYRCCIKNCTNVYLTDVTDKSYQNRHFFKFPFDLERRYKWYSAAKPFVNIENFCDKKTYYLCDIHFSFASFTNTLRARLHRVAVPFIFDESMYDVSNDEIPRIIVIENILIKPKCVENGNNITQNSEDNHETIQSNVCRSTLKENRPVKRRLIEDNHHIAENEDNNTIQSNESCHTIMDDIPIKRKRINDVDTNRKSIEKRDRSVLKTLGFRKISEMSPKKENCTMK